MERRMSDLLVGFSYKNQYLVTVLAARSWRTQWVKRDSPSNPLVTKLFWFYLSSCCEAAWPIAITALVLR